MFMIVLYSKRTLNQNSSENICFTVPKKIFYLSALLAVHQQPVSQSKSNWFIFHNKMFRSVLFQLKKCSATAATVGAFNVRCKANQFHTLYSAKQTFQTPLMASTRDQMFTGVSSSAQSLLRSKTIIRGFKNPKSPRPQRTRQTAAKRFMVTGKGTYFFVAKPGKVLLFQFYNDKFYCSIGGLKCSHSGKAHLNTGMSRKHVNRLNKTVRQFCVN
jgi:ribosomal protein L35